MSISMERMVVEALIKLRKDASLVEVDPDWFAHPLHIEMVEYLTDESTPKDVLQDVERGILKKNPNTRWNYELIQDYYFTTDNPIGNVDELQKKAWLVKQDYFDRKLQEAADKYAIDPSEENKDYLELMTELANEGTEDDLNGDISAALDAALENFFTERPPGIQSFSTIDAQLGGGWEGSTLNIIAARPSVGKTQFSVNLSLEMLTKNPDILVDVFSLEMSDEQMLRRFLSPLTGISGYKLKNAKQLCTEDDYDRFLTAYAFLKNSGLRIHNEANIDDIIRTIRKNHREAKGDYVAIIDHITIATVSDGRKTDQQRITEITGKLKRLTNELNIPIIALSQLNREVEHRQDPTPRLSDLRDSGSAEQDANNILFLSRPVEEGEDGTIYERSELLKVTIAKNRDGETGDLLFHYMKDEQRIFPAEGVTV